MTDCYLFTIFQEGDGRVKIKVFNFFELFSVHCKGDSFSKSDLFSTKSFVNFPKSFVIFPKSFLIFPIACHFRAGKEEKRRGKAL